jgi:hypothetical protein
MKTKLIRDVPVGALLVVLSIWCIALVQYLADWPDVFSTIGIIVFAVIGQRLLFVGIDVISGVYIEDKNDKE